MDRMLDAPPVPFTSTEAAQLLAVLQQKRIGARLLELLAHGWGHLDIIVTEHTILKGYLTKTDA